jgi:excinuclease ABC subunit C
VARLPPGPGVYRFLDAAGAVLYLGRAACLRRRVASYWGDLGDRGHLAAMVARIARVEAVPCASGHEAAWLERNLLQRGKPPWNRNPSGGQESEVWIRLSSSADAPGLTVARRPREPNASWPAPVAPPPASGLTWPAPRRRCWTGIRPR